MDVDFAGCTFAGQVAIVLSEPEKELHLHSLGLEVEGAEVGGKPVPFRLEPKEEQLRVGPLPSGTREVVVRYRGKVSTDSLTGFYRSRHGPGGYLLTTHLAPTGARRVLPCVDHPAAKAVFEAEVTTGADVEVVFNTDPAEVVERGGRKTWRFLPTPKMSTYLLYLGVGKFDTLEETREGLRVAVRGPPGSRGSLAWGVDNGHKSVQAYAKYYGIPYPLPKLDLVSVHDFAAGAMENWGAITFRESALLSDRGTSTLRRQLIAEVVSHEIAHQWFGNLVTMAWWNDVWLNESFATVMAFKMVDRSYPEWDTQGQFLVSQTGPALLGDALESTHPIDVEVHNVEEVSQIFDDISYGKGGSVLAMLESYLGEEAFRQGVGQYLREHAYGNATGDDLWRALEKSSGAPVRRIIDPWIHRPGHPVVHVERDGGRLRLSQHRFRLEGAGGTTGKGEETWPIPLKCRAQGKERTELFDGPTMELALPECDDLTVNSASRGFYRVQYDGPTYDRLRRGFPRLPPHERWGIVRDLYAFLLTGEIEPKLYRSYLTTLRAESDWMVTLEAIGQVQRLHSVLGGRGPIASDLRAFLRAQSDRLGPERRPREPASTGVARESVNFARAFVEVEFARSLAERFRDWKEMDPDLRGPVAVAYARSDGSAAFDPLVEKAREARNEAELEQLMVGLVSFRDSSLVSRALDWALSGEVSRGLLSSVGVAAAMNPDGRKVAWNWFRDHLGEFERVYNGTAMLTLMVERVVPMAGIGRQAEVRKLLTSRPIAEAGRGATKGLEFLRVYERLRERLS